MNGDSTRLRRSCEPCSATRKRLMGRGGFPPSLTGSFSAHHTAVWVDFSLQVAGIRWRSPGSVSCNPHDERVPRSERDEFRLPDFLHDPFLMQRLQTSAFCANKWDAKITSTFLRVPRRSFPTYHPRKRNESAAWQSAITACESLRSCRATYVSIEMAAAMTGPDILRSSRSR